MSLKDKELRVVPLDPDCKPHVGSMAEAIEGVIEYYLDGKHVTLAEIVGTLEVIKHEYIQTAIEEERY